MHLSRLNFLFLFPRFLGHKKVLGARGGKQDVFFGGGGGKSKLFLGIWFLTPLETRCSYGNFSISEDKYKDVP